MEGSVPLCFVEQMAALTSGSLPLMQQEVQVSHVHSSCNPASLMKVSGQEGSLSAQNCTEKQYFVSTATLPDTLQVCNTVNTFPSVLMSPLQTPDKDSPCSISASVLDKLHSVLLPNLSTNVPTTLPQYTSNDNQLLVGANSGAEDTAHAVVGVASDLHSSLPVVQLTNSDIAVPSTGVDESIHGQVNCNIAANSNVLMSSDVSVLPVSASVKNLSTVQLPSEYRVQ